MKQEIIESGKTVDEAVARAAEKLGVPAEKVSYEVLTEAKKGFFGIGEVLAKVKVTYSPSPIDNAKDFLETLISNMGIDASVVETEDEDGLKLELEGENAGVLIGHHGETLDQLQYLVNLSANRGEEDGDGYAKISLDIDGYRAKRNDTLRQLARRMASRVIKYRRSVTLEPMSPYERRVIHSEVQKIEGVATNSIGNDSNRRVVIFLEGKRDR
ncbi:MAG: protein jag [Clostridia bacterium]|nr:protein jag [Clostridia bacterium]